jgi:uncharacterized membrane protein YcgQ (UPF0703/DUF1980 family)
MKCCAADAVPADVVIIAPEPVTQFKPMDWVEVEGLIQFRMRLNRNEYVPVLQVPSLDKVTKTTPESDLYLQ